MAPRKISRMSTAALIKEVNSPTTARRAADDRELPEATVARYSRAVASSSLRAATAARHSSGTEVRRSNHPRARSSRSPVTCARPSAPKLAAVPVSECAARSEEHTSELQSHSDLVCRLLLEKKKKK